MYFMQCIDCIHTVPLESGDRDCKIFGKITPKHLMCNEEKPKMTKQINYSEEIKKLLNRINLLENFIEEWKDVLLTNMTEETYNQTMKKPY